MLLNQVPYPYCACNGATAVLLVCVSAFYPFASASTLLSVTVCYCILRRLRHCTCLRLCHLFPPSMPLHLPQFVAFVTAFCDTAFTSFASIYPQPSVPLRLFSAFVATASASALFADQVAVQEWVVSNAELCEQWNEYVEAERTRHALEIEERVVSFKISVSAPDPFCELQLFEDQVSQCQQAVVGHRDPAAPASESALSKVLQSFGWPLSEEELTELLLKAEDAQVFAVQDANTQGLEHMCGDEIECNWFTEIACEHAVHFYKAVDPAVDSLTKSQLNKSEAQYLLENNHSTVQDLKEAMASIYDAFPEELTIAYKGVTLENSDTLEGLGVAYRRSHAHTLRGIYRKTVKFDPYRCQVL